MGVSEPAGEELCSKRSPEVVVVVIVVADVIVVALTVVVVVSDLLDNSGSDARSVLAGGSVPGWSPEVAVVLWRRILGCLGNVNKISDVNIHEEVYEYLSDLVSTLVKVISADCHFFLFVFVFFQDLVFVFCLSFCSFSISGFDLFCNHLFRIFVLYLTVGGLGQLSLAIPLWVGAVSTSECWDVNMHTTR